MKLGFTEINGQEVKVTDMEYLHTYIDNKGEKIAVFEFEGKKSKKKLLNKK
jgi:hypothetical protein